MGKSPAILWQTPTGWSLLTGSGRAVLSHQLTDQRPPQLAVSAIVAALGQLAPSRRKIVVAFGAAEVLVARVPPGQLRSVRRAPQALAYQIEPQLPWSAEEITVQVGNGGAVLAARTEDWEGFLLALRDAGHQVVALLPAASLLILSLAKQQAHSGSGLLNEDADGLHFWLFSGASMQDWRFWPNAQADDEPAAAAIVQEIAAASIGPLSVAAPGWSTRLRAAGLDVLDAPLDSRPVEERLWAAAWGRGATVAQANLAINSLAGQEQRQRVQRSVRTTLLLLMLLGLAIAGVCWHRTQELRTQLAAQQQELERLFVETFPDTPIPAAITSRLASKHRELRGARSGSEVELPGSALRGLQIVLQAHRTPLRSRFEEIVIQDHTVEIESQFRSHQEAIRMVEALRKAGLEVTPPQTENLEEGRVGTRLRGTVLPPAAEARR